MYKTFKRLARRTTPEQLAGRRPDVVKRREQLLVHAKRHPLDVDLAIGIAGAPSSALQELDRFSPGEINVLSGAVEYFLELNDDEPDLKSADGFEDDRLVVNIVLDAIGRPDLRVLDAALAVGD